MLSSVSRSARLRAPQLVHIKSARGIALKAYNEDRELNLKARLAKLPPPGQAFVNEDGSPRKASDAELGELAEVAALYKTTRAGILDVLFLGQQHAKLYRENTDALKDYYYFGRRILDKIPVKDKETGKVTWIVKREGAEKEDWHNLMYYGYVPALFLLFVGVLNRSEDGGPSKWAKEELRLRVLEQNPGLLDGAKSDKERDARIIERIIAGDYDKLASLQKKASKQPENLL